MATPADVAQQEADETLKAHKKKRGANACYPCAKRKVRCSGGQPCATCISRSHPDICFYLGSGRSADRKRRASQEEPSTSASQRPHPSPTQTRTPQISAEASPLDHNDTIDHGTGRSGLGAHSMAFYLRDYLQDTSSPSVATPASAPIREAASRTGDQITKSCPTRSEVFRFFYSFRTLVAPFHAVVEDVDALELSIFDFLNVFETASNIDEKASRQVVEQNRQEVSLYLAVLSLGAQVSDLSSTERARNARDLVDRSMAALNFADLLFSPSATGVRALLLIGMCLQNMRSFEASWSLLGMTFRLAQMLHLHELTNSNHLLWQISLPIASIVVSELMIARKCIVRQDFILSLRFGRKPLHDVGDAMTSRVEKPGEMTHSYQDAMCALTIIGVSYTASDNAQRGDLVHVHGWLTKLDLLRKKVEPFLQSVNNCKSLQETSQCHVFHTHIAFFEAEICRPFVSITPSAASQVQFDLRNNAISNMQAVCETYLTLAKITTLPLRSWSLMQEALGCACVLGLLTHTAGLPRVHILIKNLLLLFEAELSDETAEPDKSMQVFHRAVRVLQAIRSKHRSQTSLFDRPAGQGQLSSGPPDQAAQKGLAAPTTLSSQPRNSTMRPGGDAAHPWQIPTWNDMDDISLSAFFEWSDTIVDTDGFSFS